MESRNFLKDMYDDFFGIEKLRKENDALREELELNDNDYPVIEVDKKTGDTKNDVTITKEQKDKKMLEYFDMLEKLYITDESKETIKKIIEYMRKYSEEIVKEYIKFNLCIYSDNKEDINSIIKIIADMSIYFSYIRKADTAQFSLYKLDKPEEIDKVYNKEHSIIVLKDLEGLISQEQSFKDEFWHRLDEKCENEKDYLTIIVSKSKDIINSAFEKNEEIKERLFGFEIISVRPDAQDVYHEVLNKLQESYDITEEAQVALLDYINATYIKTSLSNSEYRDKLCQKILFSTKQNISLEDIPTYEKEKSLDEVFAELNELVGLTKVKQVLYDLVSLIELKKKADDLNIKSTNLHMVFLGNPGTGKTTVARIIAEILYNLQYVKQNKLIEVSSKDLVAEYVGQTSPKTMAVIEKARGGVLFIDEAYSLASGNGQGNSYNEEAIATLIQAMENYRDDLVVIFAGYTKEMQAFLNSNSGIVSRIGYTLEFEDYTEDELVEIFKKMIVKSGFDITKEAIDEAKRVIKEYKNSKNFGNARFARNLYEKTIVKHAANTKNKKSKKALKTIQKEDISVENLIK